MQEKLIKTISQQKIYPIVRCKDADTAIDTAKALVDAGIKVLEITIENTTSYKAIEEMSKQATVCAGGIITSNQADTAFYCGAKLFSSPIFQMNMVKISKNKRIPFIAGASTANEAYAAWKTRVPLIKIYPTTALGGVLYIEDMLRPMPFLSIIPQGNIKLEEVPAYLQAGATAVGIGRNLYEGYSFSEITKRVSDMLKEVED